MGLLLFFFFFGFFFGGGKVESRLEKKGEVRKAVSHQGGRVEQSRLHAGSRLRRRRRGEKVKSDHITPLPSNQWQGETERERGGEEEMWRWTRWRRGREEGGMQSEEAESRQGGGKIKNIKEESVKWGCTTQNRVEKQERVTQKNIKVEKNWGLLRNRQEGNVVIVSNKKAEEIALNFQLGSTRRWRTRCCAAIDLAAKQPQVLESFLVTAKEAVTSCSCTCYKLVCVYRCFSDALDKSCSTDVTEEFPFHFSSSLLYTQHSWQIWPHGFWSSAASPKGPVGAPIVPLSIVSIGQKRFLPF